MYKSNDHTTPNKQLVDSLICKVIEKYKSDLVSTEEQIMKVDRFFDETANKIDELKEKLETIRNKPNKTKEGSDHKEIVTLFWAKEALERSYDEVDLDFACETRQFHTKELREINEKIDLLESIRKDIDYL